MHVYLENKRDKLEKSYTTVAIHSNISLTK